MDQLPDHFVWKLSELSVERQTLFECYYCHFSLETLQKSEIVRRAVYEFVRDTNLVK